jgi:hypothetical protein
LHDLLFKLQVCKLQLQRAPTVLTILLIWPISAESPVATTTALAWPLVTAVAL